MIHSEREALQNCPQCGRDFCAECLVDLNGSRLCKTCVAQLAERGRHYEHDHRYHYKPHKYARKERSSKFLLFILSALPGLGYMYLGLIKRGIFAMMMFFLTIYLSTMFGMMGFLIPVVFFATFFDGFRILRQQREGEHVVDGIEDITAFFRGRKVGVIVIGSVAAILLINVLSSAMRYSEYRFYSGARNLVPLVLIGLGAYFLFFRREKRRGSPYDYNREEPRDYRDDGRNQ